MAQGVITDIGRAKLCKAHAGDTPLPAITHMVFGNGGINDEGVVRETTGKEEGMYHELLRKTIESYKFIGDGATCRYLVRLERSELPGESISEQGLIDSDGSLIAYKTFLPKGKDDDVEFVFEMDEIF